jgi:hypothetical protein
VAHIEVCYRCPACDRGYDTRRKAIDCRNSHPAIEEKWAIGKGGKGVRIYDNWAPSSRHGIIGALREADLSDNIEERKRQLEGLKNERL